MEELENEKVQPYRNTLNYLRLYMPVEDKS
jgi:hypothetical protein